MRSAPLTCKAACEMAFTDHKDVELIKLSSDMLYEDAVMMIHAHILDLDV